MRPASRSPSVISSSSRAASPSLPISPPNASGCSCARAAVPSTRPSTGRRSPPVENEMFGDKKTPRSGSGNVETLIGPHAVIRGDVVFTGGLYVEGAIHGKVCAEDGAKAVLTISEHGRVEGEARAPVVVVNGTMVGDIHASERVELAEHARVQGNIHYKVIEMAAGAMITGRLIHADASLAQLAAADATGPVAVTPLTKRVREAQEA